MPRPMPIVVHMHVQVPSTTQHEMSLVNEPHGTQLPNLTPLDYQNLGSCRDRDGRAGVPYLAARSIQAGEEATVCYGPSFRREYATVCADAPLMQRWTALQARAEDRRRRAKRRWRRP